MIIKKIFLSGPIKGLERIDSLTWRINVEKELGKDFIVLNPLRNREKPGSFPYPKGIVIRDKQDILSSDIVLVNDTFTNASMIGTSMEVFLAYEKEKFVIVFGEAHPEDIWLNYHTHIRFKTLDEAISFIKIMLHE